jgi:hypothetical protein
MVFSMNGRGTGAPPAVGLNVNAARSSYKTHSRLTDVIYPECLLDERVRLETCPRRSAAISAAPAHHERLARVRGRRLRAGLSAFPRADSRQGGTVVGLPSGTLPPGALAQISGGLGESHHPDYLAPGGGAPPIDVLLPSGLEQVHRASKGLFLNCQQIVQACKHAHLRLRLGMGICPAARVDVSRETQTLSE